MCMQQPENSGKNYISGNKIIVQEFYRMGGKNISAFKTALSFAGCFLGAGFVSGQELFQFFLSFGAWGILGLFVAIALLVLFGTIVFEIVQKTGEVQVDKVICGEKFLPLRRTIAFLEMFFMFGVFVIMASGAGTLLNSMFGINYGIATALFCLAAIPAVLIGISSMVTIFSAVVPLISAFICIAGIFALKTPDAVRFSALNTPNNNVLLNNWLISAIVYVSYNMFAGIPIIIPLATVSKKGKKGAFACALGGMVLFLIALSIAVLMAKDPASKNYDLPMLEVFKSLNIYVSYVYAILLMCAMFSAGTSSLISANEYIKDKFLKNAKGNHPIIIITVIIILLAWVLTLFGFANLVGTVYPVCGYFGFIVLALLISKLFKKE